MCIRQKWFEGSFIWPQKILFFYILKSYSSVSPYNIHMCRRNEIFWISRPISNSFTLSPPRSTNQLISNMISEATLLPIINKGILKNNSQNITPQSVSGGNNRTSTHLLPLFPRLARLPSRHSVATLVGVAISTPTTHVHSSAHSMNGASNNSKNEVYLPRPWIHTSTTAPSKYISISTSTWHCRRQLLNIQPPPITLPDNHPWDGQHGPAIIRDLFNDPPLLSSPSHPCLIV